MKLDKIKITNKQKKENLVIKSKVQSIHPFTDGNGRMARFLVSLMLIEYNDNFEFIPIKEEIYLNQEQYYESINKSHNNGNANEFIKFMLYTIDTALSKVLNNSFNLNELQSKIIESIINKKI